jgi:hypothetical protein
VSNILHEIPLRGAADQPRSQRGRCAVNARSILLGLAITAAIAALAPYNDLLVANTFLIGGTMPIGLLVAFLLLVLLVNSSARRWSPRLALTGGELGVALAIGLVGCAVPAVGFHSYVMGSLVGMWHAAGQDVQTARLLNTLALPAWLFPLPDTSDAARRALDPAIMQYVGRVPDDGQIPWRAWIAPAITWAMWLLCFGGAIICLSLIVRRQWVENERLAFPVATIYTTLLEEPAPGRAINALLRSPMFWIPFALVFGLRAINSLSLYLPLYVPAVPMGFDLRPIMTQPPLSHAGVFLKAQNVYFAVIGITFLLQTRIAFSLWFMYLAFQGVVMLAAGSGTEFSPPMQQDQTAGALLVTAAMVVWIGRAHWMVVLRQMIGRARPQDPRDPYLPYAFAGWGVVLFAVGMVVFLVLAKASLGGAVLSVALLLLVVMMIARIAAETGLYYIQLNVPLFRAWTYLHATLGMKTTTGSFFWSSFLGAAFTHDTRETLSVYSTHALKVSDALAPPARARQGLLLVGAMLLSLAVAYFVGGASMLRMEYGHAATLANPSVTPVNQYGVEHIPRELIVRPTLDHEQDRSNETHSRLLHVSTGAGIAGLLGALRFRFTNWPLHPLGFLLAFSYPIARMWFSIFLGWLAKVAAVQYGGAVLIRRLREVAIGLIVGEGAAVAFWLIIAVLRASAGNDYQVIYLTP